MKWQSSPMSARVIDPETLETIALAKDTDTARIVAAVPQMIDALRVARTYARANLQALGEYAGAGDVNTLDAIEQALRAAGVPLQASGEKSNG